MMQLDQSQSIALQQVLQWVKTKHSPWFALSGVAGSGKSSLLAKFILPELVYNYKLRVAVVAPTARAARVVATKLDEQMLGQLRYMSTIHRLMYSPILDENDKIIGWRKKRHLNQELDMIIVDESSMVGNTMEEDILSVGVPVLAIGDRAQLQPIEGRSTWMRKPSVILEQVHRQALDSHVLRLATYVREHGVLPSSLADYDVKKFVNFNKSMPSLLESYDRDSPSQISFVCFTNRHRCDVNHRVHKALFDTDEVVTGTQVVCLRNNHKLDVYNGERGFLERNLVKGKDYWSCQAAFEGNQGFMHVQFPIAQFGNTELMDKMYEEETSLDMGYALTAHKCQGSSFKEVYILLDKPRDHDDYRKWLYTALTRASHKVNLIYTLGNK